MCSLWFILAGFRGKCHQHQFPSQSSFHIEIITCTAVASFLAFHMEIITCTAVSSFLANDQSTTVQQIKKKKTWLVRWPLIKTKRTRQIHLQWLWSEIFHWWNWHSWQWCQWSGHHRQAAWHHSLSPAVGCHQPGNSLAENASPAIENEDKF